MEVSGLYTVGQNASTAMLAHKNSKESAHACQAAQVHFGEMASVRREQVLAEVHVMIRIHMIANGVVIIHGRDGLKQMIQLRNSRQFSALHRHGMRCSSGSGFSL
jgi:hypothetical protein